MNYKFRLQKILDVKEKEEDNKKNEVGVVNREITLAEKQLQDIVNELNETGVKREALNKNGASIKEILELNVYIDYLKLQLKKKEQEIDILIEKLDIKKQEYIESRKVRKTYETLKDKEYQKFLAKEAKEEEKVIDEIISFTSRKV